MKTSRYSLLGACLCLLLGAAVARGWWIEEYISGIIWPEPPVIDPGGSDFGRSGKAPSDAIVLFDGTDLSAWNDSDKWQIADGVATAAGNGITSKQGFGDCQLHLEFATPEKVEGDGQGRGNSGVYFMGHYEVQILDSYGNKTYFDGQCASLYKQHPPTVNASRKPGEWQSYDILFTAPKFDAQGVVVTPAYATVFHNGVAVHNHVALEGSTAWHEPPKYTAHGEREPIHLQFHGNPIRFRNIWLRENIAALEGKKP
jgi:hypothetical protein